MYQLGQGVAKDAVQAYAHFTVAVALGHKGAPENVSELQGVLTVSKLIEGKERAGKLLGAIEKSPSGS
jgi:TPR repeat protein